MVVYGFFDEVKKDRWHPDKILLSWDVSVHEFGQEVLFLVFEGSRALPRGLVAFFLSWRLAGAVTVVVAVGKVMVLGSNVSFSVFLSRCKSKYLAGLVSLYDV